MESKSFYRRCPERHSDTAETFMSQGSNDDVTQPTNGEVLLVSIGNVLKFQIKGVSLYQILYDTCRFGNGVTLNHINLEMCFFNTFDTNSYLCSHESYLKTYIVTGFETCGTVVILSNLTRFTLRRILLVQIETCRLLQRFNRTRVHYDTGTQ